MNRGVRISTTPREPTALASAAETPNADAASSTVASSIRSAPTLVPSTSASAREAVTAFELPPREQDTTGAHNTMAPHTVMVLRMA